MERPRPFRSSSCRAVSFSSIRPDTASSSGSMMVGASREGPRAWRSARSRRIASMLVNCVAYQDGKKLGEITKREIHEYLSRPNCFVWVALRDAGDEELREMQEEFGLHDLAVEDARH